MDGETGFTMNAQPIGFLRLAAYQISTTQTTVKCAACLQQPMGYHCKSACYLDTLQERWLVGLKHVTSSLIGPINHAPTCEPSLSWCKSTLKLYVYIPISSVVTRHRCVTFGSKNFFSDEL